MPPSRDEDEKNQWSAYRREVMKTLDDLDQDIRELDKKLDGHHSDLVNKISEHKEHLQSQIYKLQLKVTEDITALKTKASTWGGAFGSLSGAVVGVLVSIIFNSIFHR